MTPAQIEAWAREAGLEVAVSHDCGIRNYWVDDGDGAAFSRLADLAFAAGAEAMRRDALQMMDGLDRRQWGDSGRVAVVYENIRALPIPKE